MNKDYAPLKGTAVRLRKQGKSYGEIQGKVPVAKSTLSLWLKSVPLTKAQKERLYTKQVYALSLGSQSQRERRLREVETITREAEHEAQSFKTRGSYALFGAALYWAEGSKSGGFSITNSDPHLILFMVRWLRDIFGIKHDCLTLTLNLYPQQDEAKVKKFWSELTGIPLENFRKTFIKPPNKGYKKNNLYYGTCKLKVARGTDLRYRVFGWVQAVTADLHPTVELTQKRWQALRNVARPANIDMDAPVA